LIELRDSGLRTERGQNAEGDPQAWKKLIGDKPVDARLDTLPENKIRRSAFAISSSVQLVLALALIALPLFFPESLSVRMTYQVTPLAAPLTEVPVHAEEPVERPKSEALPAKPIEPVHVAKLMAPQPLIAPKPKVPERLNMDAPKLQPVLAPTKLDTSMAEPERPREPVKTGVLSMGSDAQPTLKAALDKVQTGGFGDPNGFASDTPEAKHGNVARLGSFQLPVGPGYGNGTGGAHGARGTVASTGFGNGIAATAAARGPHGAVQSSSFGSVTIVPESKSTPRHAEETAAIQPVEILEKPNPVYSDEARRLGIEGEVLVEVIFRTSGQVETVRIVKGLGHGLDESALRAAGQIRFKPALQSGHAVDFPAIAHIVFQLAF
jgi:TonB family protein